MVYLASENYVDSVEYLRRLLNVKSGGPTAVAIRIMTAYFSGVDNRSEVTE
jgi:hypothetical protein